MNISLIQDTINQSLAATMTFPQIVGALLKEDIATYHVDLLRTENRYYHTNGETHVEKVNLVHRPAASDFSAAGVEKAVRLAQAGKCTYQEFVTYILEAGCVYYIAYLSGKKVVYSGLNGESHTEYFPQVR